VVAPVVPADAKPLERRVTALFGTRIGAGFAVPRGVI
jgi:hypothetical protein